MMLKQLFKRYTEQNWALGFVRGGMHSVMESDHFDVDWVKMPKDRWFADPFVLDVTDDEILLLVEDFGYNVHKGVISLLRINRTTMEITSRKVLLEIPTHLSFPIILRKDGHIYVYPESMGSGRLVMYEYLPESQTMKFVKPICDDKVWDSVMVDDFGEQLLFTSAHGDDILDIYRWNEKKQRYISYFQIPSDIPNCRMGGNVFKYKGQYYYPAQYNEKTYGGALDIKPLKEEGGKLKVEGVVKRIESPNMRYPLGLHTLNEYKGVVVIDVKGYRYGKMGSLLNSILNLKKVFRHAK